MRVLIVEDEQSVARNLCDLLLEVDSKIEIMDILESVESVVEWVGHNPPPDLGFFDIRIADGTSFEIFERAEITFPIVFTTAYDEYALQAFRVNSIDYLIKPIKKQELANAMERYSKLYAPQTDNKVLLDVIQELRSEKKKYKKSFLVYVKDKILPLNTYEIAYFILENEVNHCYTHKGEKYDLDQSLEKIQSQLDPDDFFRANRQCIVSRKAVNAAAIHFHRKLKLELLPPPPEDVLISKPKASEFKRWLMGEN